MNKELDTEIDIMVEKIKHPNTWPSWEKKYIYESPDGGKTVYQREFGADVSTRVQIKPEEGNRND